MKAAAVITSRVMDAICRLPGIATLDWCDRAAAAISRIHHPSIVSVMLCSLDLRGFISSIEVAGASASMPVEALTYLGFDPVTGKTDGATPATNAKPAADVPQLIRLRDRYKAGDWIGWNTGLLHESRMTLATANAQGLLAIRNESPLSRRWDAFSPTDVLLSAFLIPGATPGRALVVEVGSPDPDFRDSAREQVILAAALPMLAQRLYAAVGPERAEVHRWLTPREEVILWRLVAGQKVPEIAEELHRSIYTVHDHVKSLHRKLGATSRGQLVARALGHMGQTINDGHPSTANLEIVERANGQVVITQMGLRGPGNAGGQVVLEVDNDGEVHKPAGR